jgi:hypothetical protein
MRYTPFSRRSTPTSWSSSAKPMTYPAPTCSQPVRGAEAQRLARALATGGDVASAAALATIARIQARRR